MGGGADWGKTKKIKIDARGRRAVIMSCKNKCLMQPRLGGSWSGSSPPRTCVLL